MNQGRVVHRDNFAALRLLAASAVIYGHAFYLTGQTSPGLLYSPVGTIAVKVFFVISGFLITESWDRDANLLRYMIRRSLRIFPALAVLALLTVAVVGPLYTSLSVAEYMAAEGTRHYLWNIFLFPVYALPGVFTSNVYPVAVNGSLWTLPVEFFMYLTLPFALMFDRLVRFSLPIISVTVFGLAGVLGTMPASEPLVIYGTSLPAASAMAPYFLAGATFRRYLDWIPLNLQCGILAAFSAPFITGSPLLQETCLFVLLPYAVLSFAKAPIPAFAAVDRVGDLSYGIYLYGFVVQQCVAVTFKTDGQPSLNAIIALLVSCGLAKLSWHFVEKPALRLKPRSLGSFRPSLAGIQP
ncbi:acyltransferase family protein [Tianweitania populi]|uniref:Acyltransferase n=1 Tax=Tianweitania populi TaxID=1607949 RepID=A0A8J3DSB8_9HYPH|nr:acyltransferase [Tianweitania populi]GHD21390.1 acyltransferase [Tianweitania populi]